MDKINNWIKKSNEWDDRQLAKIRTSKYYPDLIELECWIIVFTALFMPLLWLLLIITFQDLTIEDPTLYERIRFGIITLVSGIVMFYWTIFRIWPQAIQKAKEAKKLKKEYKEKHNG